MKISENPLGGKIYFKVFYDGGGYRGWAKQKDKNTVQATLEEALKKTGARVDGLSAFSRTDAGVSALSQIVRVRGNSIRPAATNRVLPEDIAITHYSTKLEGLKSKTYVYIKGDRWRRPSLVQQAVQRVLVTGGAELYKKGGAPPTRNLSIELLSTESQEYVFFKAKGFGYQQVRMVMGYLEAVDSQGCVTIDRSKISPAEAAGLILLKVELGGDWVEVENGVVKVKRYLHSKISDLEHKLSLYRFMSCHFT